MSTMGSDFVREARKRAGLTQRELADRAGTTQSAIARLEAGRTQPGFDNVLRIVQLCGMDLSSRLVPHDSSEWMQAQELLKLPPGERLERAVRFAKRIQRLRAEVGTSA